MKYGTISCRRKAERRFCKAGKGEESRRGGGLRGAGRESNEIDGC